MPSPTRFFIGALSAGAAAIVLLAGGMAFTVSRIETISSEQLAYVRAAEDRITLVERLRASAELVISAGRGYLLAADTRMIPQLEAAESTFYRGMARLGDEALTPEAMETVYEAELAGREFQSIQKHLLVVRPLYPAEELARIFEAELVPQALELQAALGRLVELKERAVDAAYHKAELDRRHLARQMYGLLVTLVAVASLLTWASARQLMYAYTRQRDALEDARLALLARDEILGIVAHDLRNPLGAIVMKAALLQRQSESEQTRQRAESIRKVAGRMESLIKRMLDVATLEAGRLQVNAAPCDADDLLRDVSDMFGELAAAKQIRLDLSAGSPVPTLLVDRARVLEVLSNLIGNAFKFTPPGGWVGVSLERDGDMVRFAVADTGPGIARDHVAHLFDRFWKHETSGKKGTGLGLFIVKGIVEAHGGRVWAESEPGRGATFFFTLPVATPAPHRSRAPPHGR